MMGAAYISNLLGLLTDEEIDRQRSLLESYELPTHASGLDKGHLLEAMKSDKKTVSGDVTWVLLKGIGNAVTRTGVPGDAVSEALNTIIIPKVN